MRIVKFVGSSRNDLRSFPQSVREDAGYQLEKVQRGLEPVDWKPMKTIGVGVIEIRIRNESGAFRVIYVAKLGDAIYVLHCFQKKSYQTLGQDLHVAQVEISTTYARCIMKKQQGFKSVWDAIEDSPAEAANMERRSALMMTITGHIADQGWTQAKAAKVLGITQPRVSDLMRGKISLFSFDMLAQLLSALGFRVEMRVTKGKRRAA
jgi:phage-related protein/predicted XRE-type DNA-binding protein